MASKFQVSGADLMDIWDGANQPHSFTFPKRKFGIKKNIVLISTIMVRKMAVVALQRGKLFCLLLRLY